MKVRPATPADYAGVMRLYGGLCEDDQRFARPGNDSFEYIVSSETDALFVAEDDEKVIGFITVLCRRVIRYPVPIAQIEELYVDPTNRAHGTGRALVEAAEDFARGQNCKCVYVESSLPREDAHNFYQHIGYAKEGLFFKKNF